MAVENQTYSATSIIFVRIFSRTHAHPSETKYIERSKKYFYEPRVIATIANNVASTRCCESIEVGPVKIELTLLEFFCYDKRLQQRTTATNNLVRAQHKHTRMSTTTTPAQ